MKMSSYLEHIAKKPRISSRVDEGSNETESSIVVANKIIKLKFLESFNPVKYSSHSPDFTHQLFKEEEIDYLESTEDYEISIYINTCDLSHCVVYNSSVTHIDRQLLVRDLDVGLPDGTPHLSSSECKEKVIFDKFECHPPGKLLHSFTVKDCVYEMYLATAVDPGATQLLRRGEKIAMWYIETADSVDFEDSRWEVIFLFRKVKAPNDDSKSCSPGSTVPPVPTHLFVGYFTLFTFHNPFQGSKLRICQALILPSYQGLSLGRHIMMKIYELVRQRENISEITVEDPCPGFQIMRDNVDFEWSVLRFKGHESDSRDSSSKSNSLDSTANILPLIVSKWSNDTSEMCKELKIIKAQAIFILEAMAYLEIVNLHKNDDKPIESSAEFKEFRLRIKKRLFKSDPELKLMSKTQMQDELTKMFDVEHKRYVSIVRTAHRLGLC